MNHMTNEQNMATIKTSHMVVNEVAYRQTHILSNQKQKKLRKGNDKYWPCLNKRHGLLVTKIALETQTNTNTRRTN